VLVLPLVFPQCTPTAGDNRERLDYYSVTKHVETTGRPQTAYTGRIIGAVSHMLALCCYSSACIYSCSSYMVSYFRDTCQLFPKKKKKPRLYL